MSFGKRLATFVVVLGTSISVLGHCPLAFIATGRMEALSFPPAGGRSSVDLGEAVKAAADLGFDVSAVYRQPTRQTQYATLLKALKAQLDQQGITPEKFVRSLPKHTYEKVRDLIDATFARAAKLGRPVQWHDNPEMKDFYDPNDNTINILPLFLLWGEEGRFLTLLATEHEAHHVRVEPQFRLGQTFEHYVRENYVSYALDETCATLADTLLSKELSQRGFEYSIGAYGEHTAMIEQLSAAAAIGDLALVAASLTKVSEGADSSSRLKYHDTWMRNLESLFGQQGLRAEVAAMKEYIELTGWTPEARAKRVRQILNASANRELLARSFRDLHAVVNRLGAAAAARIYQCTQAYLIELSKVVPLL